MISGFSSPSAVPRIAQFTMSSLERSFGLVAISRMACATNRKRCAGRSRIALVHLVEALDDGGRVAIAEADILDQDDAGAATDFSSSPGW